MTKVTVTRRFHTRASRRRASEHGAEPAKRVPRVSKLMALAVTFDQLIREGAAVDQAELARIGRVTRARLTQIMNLLNLVPEIQGQLLDMTIPNAIGRDISERQIRPIAAMPCWRRQRRAWRKAWPRQFGGH